jgi:hypothetical protein
MLPTRPGATLADLATAKGQLQAAREAAFAGGGDGRGLGSFMSGIGALVQRAKVKDVEDKTRDVIQQRENIELEKARSQMQRQRQLNKQEAIELRKQEGMESLDRVSTSIDQGIDIDPEDARRAQIQFNPDGSVRDNADWLRGRGVNVGSLMKTNLGLAMVLKNPYSPLRQKELLKVIQGEDAFQQDMAKLDKRLGDKEGDLTDKHLKTAASLGGKMSAMMRDIAQGIEKGFMTEEHGRSMFVSGVMPMFKLFNKALLRTGVDPKQTEADLVDAYLEIEQGQVADKVIDLVGGLANYSALLSRRAGESETSPRKTKDGTKPTTLTGSQGEGTNTSGTPVTLNPNEKSDLGILLGGVPKK